MDLTKPKDVKDLMKSSKSTKEWNANCDKVKAANGSNYPDFWYAEIIQSGDAANTVTAFEETAE